LANALGPMVGDLFILAAVAAWVLYTTEGKRFAAAHGPIRTTAWTMIFAALWCLPAAPFAVKVGELKAATPAGWACLAYIVLLTSVLSYLLWYYALSKREASTVAVFSNLQPVITAVAAWWVFAQPIGWEFVAGTALVIAGVRLGQTKIAPPQPGG